MTNGYKVTTLKLGNTARSHTPFLEGKHPRLLNSNGVGPALLLGLLSAFRPLCFP